MVISSKGIYYVSRVNLGSPLGLCARSALFSGLLLESLLSVVGHNRGRERVCRYDVDIMIVVHGSRESAPSNSPPESIAGTYEKKGGEGGRKRFEERVIALCLSTHACT